MRVCNFTSVETPKDVPRKREGGGALIRRSIPGCLDAFVSSPWPDVDGVHADTRDNPNKSPSMLANSGALSCSDLPHGRQPLFQHQPHTELSEVALGLEPSNSARSVNSTPRGGESGLCGGPSHNASCAAPPEPMAGPNPGPGLGHGPQKVGTRPKPWGTIALSVGSLEKSVISGKKGPFGVGSPRSDARGDGKRRRGRVNNSS